MRCILILPLLVWASFAQARDLVLSADVWCPYNCDPRSDRPGFAIEIARAIFAGSGRSVVYRVVAWSRGIVEAQAGRIDGIISASQGEAPGLIYPKEPVGMSHTGLAVRRDYDFELAGARPFEGQVIGVVAGYIYPGMLGGYIRAHAGDDGVVQSLAGENALALNLRKLAAGRVDIVADDADVIARAIESQGFSGRLRIAARDEGDPVYIAFSSAIPDGRALARTFDLGMARLRTSGRLARILARYKIHDWK